MPAQATLRIQLLGTFRVAIDGQPVAPGFWRSRRASTLVKLLALAPRHRLSREQLADTLWPDFDLDAQLNNLNVATTRARRALTTAGAIGQTFLTRDGDALVLGPDEAVWVDVAAFEQGVAEGWQTLDPVVCRTVLSLYGGDLLPDDAYEEWVDGRRTALRNQFLALLARLGQLHNERGEGSDAIEVFQRLVAEEPADEAAHASLIRLFAERGQRQHALAQFDRLTTALRKHLDAEPARTTVALVQEIRAERASNVLASPTAREQVAVGAARSGDLPLPLDELIGRERGLAELCAKLTHSRLVTLTGPGGIGKTRLALAVAHELEGSFPDGVVFVDLSAVDAAPAVVTVIAQALDLGGPGAQSSIASLVAALSTRRVLLVLDNFEQVVDAAPAVASLLERTRACRILVTSRMPLRIRGEAEYPVPPLSLPDQDDAGDEQTLMQSPAAALFVQRARDAKPDFAVQPGGVAAIADICRRLDGLPLAIELAAARVKVLSPVAMLARLEKPLALLVDGARDSPERQQTIRNAIAWSHDLLSAPEQRLLRRLSVFVGGWTLEAAEVVVDVEPTLGIDVLDGLASLVEKNLVVQREVEDGQPRFALLETIREFALEQLRGTTDGPIVRERHAAAAVTVAERSTPHLEGPALSVWLARLDREHGNLRAALQGLREHGDAERALRLVNALKLYWFIRGRLVEGCEVCLAAARMPEATQYPSMRIDALNSAAFLARESGDYERALQASSEARTESERLGDSKRRADALANLGYVALQRDDRGHARTLFHACLQVNRDLGNQQGIADALSFLGMTAHYDGDLEQAWKLNEESLMIWEELGDRQAVIWARTRRGGLLMHVHRDAEATDEFMTNLTGSQALDFRWGISWSLDGLAHLAGKQGARDAAIELIETAAMVRAASGLRLPPTEQAELRRLRTELGMDDRSEAMASLSPGRMSQRVREVIERTQQALTTWGRP